MPFFHEASHRKTMRSCSCRAWASSPSTSAKSKLPSFGSTSSQLSGVTTVFSPLAASLGQSGLMYSRLDEEELCNSPPRIRNGFFFPAHVVGGGGRPPRTGRQGRKAKNQT